MYSPSLRTRAVRLPPTPCRVCFRPCVFNKFSRFWQKTHVMLVFLLYFSINYFRRKLTFVRKKNLLQDSPKPCRRRRSAAPRSGRRTGRWRCCWGWRAETATPRSSCGSARSASRRRPRNLRVQELRRQASSLLAAEPSRPRLRHRACPSRGHLPSAPGTRGASTRSTSRARCGRTYVWRAGCSPGARERALAAGATEARANASAMRCSGNNSTGSSSTRPLSG